MNYLNLTDTTIFQIMAIVCVFIDASGRLEWPARELTFEISEDQRKLQENSSKSQKYGKNQGSRKQTVFAKSKSL